MPFLIDGHNVIAALPDIDLADDNDEAQLVIKLRTWTSRIRHKAFVIFDGGITGGSSYDLSSPDVHVIFAAKFHTNADRIIRERLKALRDASNWTVVSSDLEVLDQARLAGAKVVTAQRFSEQLNQVDSVEPEKPDYVSPAAVNHWLGHFPEPKTTAEPVQVKPVTNAEKKTADKPQHNKSPVQKTRKIQSSIRDMRSIGEQLGRPLTPLPKTTVNAPQAEKPTEISAEEVDAWLQVFPEPINRQIPEPQIKQNHHRSKHPKQTVVRKTGELTSDEVAAWLQVFPEPASDSDSTQQKPEQAKPSHKQRKINTKLAKHKARLIPEEKKDQSSLTDEDRELWQRIFGSED
jgi:predicted RNA-binding protein with PIN domain